MSVDFRRSPEARVAEQHVRRQVPEGIRGHGRSQVMWGLIGEVFVSQFVQKDYSFACFQLNCLLPFFFFTFKSVFI